MELSELIASTTAGTDESVRIASIRKLSLQAPADNPAARDALLAASQDPSPAVSFQARRALAHFLARRAGAQIAKAVEDSGTEILDSIQDHLNHEDREIRLKAVGVVLERQARTNLPLLLERLATEEDAFVIARLVKVIGLLGESEVVARLAPYLEHADSRVRANTVEGLAPHRDAEVFRLLVLRLADPDNRVRANAVKTLKSYTDFQPMTALSQMVKSPHSGDRASALFVLSRLSTPEAMEAVLPLLTDPDRATQASAWGVVWQKGNLLGATLVPHLEKLTHHRPSVRTQIRVCLEELQTKVEPADKPAVLLYLDKLRPASSPSKRTHEPGRNVNAPLPNPVASLEGRRRSAPVSSGASRRAELERRAERVRLYVPAGAVLLVALLGLITSRSWTTSPPAPVRSVANSPAPSASDPGQPSASAIPVPSVIASAPPEPGERITAPASYPDLELSADGNQVIVTCRRAQAGASSPGSKAKGPGAMASDIILLDRRTGSQTTLTADGQNQRPAYWGNGLAWIHGPSEMGDLVLKNPQGTKVVTEYMAISLAAASDAGQRACVQLNMVDGRDRVIGSDIAMLDIATGERVRVRGLLDSVGGRYLTSTMRATLPLLSPDFHKVAYMSEDPTPVGRVSKLHILDLRSGVDRNFKMPGRLIQYVWNRGTDRLVCLWNTGTATELVYLVPDLLDKPHLLLRRTTDSLTGFAMNASGTTLVVTLAAVPPRVARSTTPGNLWLADASGSLRRKLTQDGRNLRPRLDAAGKRLIYCKRERVGLEAVWEQHL